VYGTKADNYIRILIEFHRFTSIYYISLHFTKARSLTLLERGRVAAGGGGGRGEVAAGGGVARSGEGKAPLLPPPFLLLLLPLPSLLPPLSSLLPPPPFLLLLLPLPLVPLADNGEAGGGAAD